MNKLIALLLVAAMTMLLAACVQSGSGGGSTDDSAAAPGEEARTFAEDLAFLREHGSVQVLRGPGGARAALSAKYQGRVMTSATRPGGRSLGWINREFIASGETGTQFDNYGGEDRFWLGPEGGQYGLYFPPDSTFDLSHWQVPAAFQEGTWNVEAASDRSVMFTRSMEVENYQGTTFELDVERTVNVLSESDVAEHFGADVPEGVEWVGFETVNRVTNTGENAWNKESGQPSIWILGQYEPFGTTYVTIPFDEGEGGEVVNDAYFGEVPAERLAVREDYVLFKADGEYRSKIGLGPAHARQTMGSYNGEEQLLTLVQYNKPEGKTDYVNSMWEIQDQPYGGDVINAYNDGPPEPGAEPLGGFYEMETSSPALSLTPGESYTHVQRTLHLIGDRRDVLEPVAQEALGVSLSIIARGIE
jgi:hypothetical protein